ncbi:hypothetical protein JY651_23265 [Pyxidicoccus parkwayensis]|uniref:Uncharacterized protein n=1 Tax=Pyxidicoccus parkwayensis TaxID=2813578 RepID=A0ABX7PB25_9BACT|nr:hypothetical protein [Pyxidicoccus parkwaysis]QSQ27650.1 hypothetical protein JY651_23265 [Pyxidicoccus parkwaysis]
MKLSKQSLFVATVFLLSASSGFALSIHGTGPVSQTPRYCTSSLECENPWGPDGECCAIQPLDPYVGICAPRNAGLPCYDF